MEVTLIRTVDFPDHISRAIRLAAMEAGISGNQVIVASVALCIAEAANNNPKLARMLKAADAEATTADASLTKVKVAA